jgi:plastocyanin
MICLVATGCARNAGQVARESPIPSFSPSPSSSPSPTAAPVPITLEGPVNNKGISDLTGMGTAVTLEITMADLAFNPTFVKVVPGAVLTITLKNPGGLADHTFTIDSLGVDRQLKPAEQAEQVVRLPATEATRFYCRLHVEKGMQGAFYFTEGDPVSTVTVAPATTAGGSSSTTGTRRTSPPAAPAARTTTAPQTTGPSANVGQGGSVQSGGGLDGRPGVPGQPGLPGEPGAPGEDGFDT